ncbi:hypothetical protein NLJ89_g5234 [Agrocybe chaxingu]|uniref:Major facilitator superfamily (MFS) profile domain-containing protein n=1 Tax=Agrocybe chaxingu TaxID=84603 RepID=A0A9W8K7K8_9AGAR|nr:hypothetical protein NLJ89_g5234 [Agrocybe chaxingu]
MDSFHYQTRSPDEKLKQKQDVLEQVPVDSETAPLSKKQRLSPYFTIAAAAFGLISDGYQNNLMTMANVVFKKLYPEVYTADVSTRVSNSLLVGAIVGQVIVGVICDRIGRKAALFLTTALIVLGATLATAAHGRNGSPSGLFWFLTFARGLTGVITFPNGVFSGTIISSIIHDGDFKRTAEWQLLLGTIALPGVFIGAALCNPLGRRNTMMLGFSGYLIFGLVIGLTYEKITKITPLFVILYGLMQSFGNMGPGDMLGLVSSESYPTAIRGTCYGLSAAIGKTGAAVGTQAFTPIQLHLGKNHRSVHAAASKLTTNRGSRATQSRSPAPDSPPSTGKTLSQLTQELDIAQRKPAKRARKPAVNIDDGHAPRNKLIAYLAHIESTKDKVALEDVEQYKHRRRPNPRSSTYDQDYTELLDVLTASFTIPQLKRFLQLYGTRPPSKRRLTKRLYAETIMEKWGWTSLAEVQQDRIDQSEVSEHQFETTSLPLGQLVNPEASQSISRASGAYVEREADGKVTQHHLHFWASELILLQLRITYRKSQPHTAQIAKRLAVQTSMMDTDASTKAIYLPEEALDILSSSNYSLYPFLPTQTSSRKLESRSAFRLRRVGHWITDDSSTDAFVERLARNSGTVVAQSSSIDIRTHLLGELAKVPFEASFLSITASSGHLLFLAPTSRPTSLVPPLVGIQEPNDILDWIKKSPDDTFFNPRWIFCHSIS